MIAFKPGVSLKGLRVQTWAGVTIAEGVWKTLGHDTVRITSGNDGVHAGHPVAGEDKDPHYTGRAVDLQLHDFPPKTRGDLVVALTTALPTGFQVLHESIGTDNEHVHIQYIEADA